MSAAGRVACDYFDGRSSKRHPVSLGVEDGHAVVEGEAVSRREPLQAVRVSERMGGAARMVSFADGAFCEVRDHDALDALLHATGYRDSIVVRMQNRWRVAAAGIAICAALVVATYLFVLPWAADQAAAHVPQSAIETMSTRTLDMLDRHLLDPSKAPPERTRALAGKFARLSPPDGAKISHRVEFRSAPRIGPNAFALPSGTIIVTDELLELTDSDDEILGVLAHELGHVARRHGVRQVLQSSVVGLFVTWYLGDVSSLLTAVPAALLEARYSRDHEREADAYAARMLRHNAMSPELLAVMLGRLERAHGSGDAGSGTDDKSNGSGLPEYLSSHPATAERIKALRKP